MFSLLNIAGIDCCFKGHSWILLLQDRNAGAKGSRLSSPGIVPGLVDCVRLILNMSDQSENPSCFPHLLYTLSISQQAESLKKTLSAVISFSYILTDRERVSIILVSIFKLS